MVHQITYLKQLEDAALKAKAAVLYFWAAWCEPCGHMDAVVLELSKQHPEVSFCRVEAEVVDEVTIKYEVTSVPTFVFLEHGNLIGTLEGADAAALTSRVEALAVSSNSSSSGRSAPVVTAAAAASTSSASDIAGRIKYVLASHPVVLFMKGTAEAPRCGFSRTVVEELQKLHVPLHCIDILQDEALRAGVKEFSQWPTYPQLYVQGELVGGCDIIKEMAASGELEQLMKDKLPASSRTGDVGPSPTAAPPAPPPSQPTASAPPPAAEAQAATISRIDSILAANDVVLFMKGNPSEPRCGFSRRVVEALRAVDVPFSSFDILSDAAVRETLKVYKEWPTYPQLYAKGELIGGCDIIMELAAAGELKSAVQP